MEVKIIINEKFKLIFIFTLIFSILMINAVYASDNENIISDSLSEDIELNDCSTIDLNEANEENLKEGSVGDDFKTVQGLIDKAKDGDSIYLENRTYKGNGTPIYINKNLNIYGFNND